MKVKNTLICIFLFLFVSGLFAQKPKEDEYVQLTDSLYSLGAEAYRNSLSRELKIPFQTFERDNEGLLIVQIKMSSEGKVSAKFMTQIDQ